MSANLHLNPYALARTAHAAPTIAWGDGVTLDPPGSPPSPGLRPEIANLREGEQLPERSLDRGFYIAHRRRPPAEARSLASRVCCGFNREFAVWATGLGITAATAFLATSQGLRATGSSDATSYGAGGLAATASAGLGAGLRWAWRQWTQRQEEAAARRYRRDLPIVPLEPPAPVANPRQSVNA